MNRNFVKYAGLGFQMLATIGILTYIGYQIDHWQEMDKPIFTALLGLAGVLLSIYQALKSILKKM